MPVRSVHSLIPVVKTGVNIAQYHKHHRKEALFRIGIVNDIDDIYGPNGKQRVRGPGPAEYIDTYV
jgi:hypothetical protein